MKNFPRQPISRPFVALLVFALGASGLPGQESLSTNLGLWNAKGGAPTTSDNIVTLPSGTQLVRTFDAAQVSVRVVSRPFFDPAPPGSPSLEVGPASLTFLRDTSGGAMVLLGDTPLALPVSIALGEDGRSKAPLDFTLSYSQPGATASLLLAGDSFTVGAAGPAGPVTVAVAAGDKTTWPLDNLAVTTTPASAPTENPGTDGSTPTAPSNDPIDVAALEASERLKEGLASAVARGAMSPAEAIDQISKASLGRYKFDADADFGFAAADIGESLIGMEKYKLAEPFFQVAEPALAAASERTAKNAEKALCLKQLIWIRSRYLRKAEQALADVEIACQLTPGDANLQQLRNRMNNRNATGTR